MFSITPFVEKCESLLFDSSIFPLLHLNIPSIPRHLHELEAYISHVHHEFSIIPVSETWLSDATIDTYQMEGHAHEYQYCKDKCGGGGFLFVKNDLSYILRKYLILFNQSVEFLFIRLQNTDSSRSNSIIVGVIYRPPNTNIIHFNEALSTLLDKVKLENKQVYLSGDYDITLINTDKHQPSVEFLESMFSYSLYPMINRPTRIRESSATLIDDIFFNCPETWFVDRYFIHWYQLSFPAVCNWLWPENCWYAPIYNCKAVLRKEYLIISVQTSTDWVYRGVTYE